MAFEPVYKKPGDLIRSEEWNRMVEELVGLRKYIDSMTRSMTLTQLASPVGKSFNLASGVEDAISYGTDIMGLITKQYYLGKNLTGAVSKFGINDYADTLSYWSGADNGDRDALDIAIEYVDSSIYSAKGLFVHEWSNLRPRGAKNPYVEYLQSPNQRLWYRYVLVNPNPDKEIRYITFTDANPECGLRIANVLHYTTRIKPLALPARS